MAPRAQAAPAHSRAQPEQLGSSPWPLELASGRPKGEGSPLSTTRHCPALLEGFAVPRWFGNDLLQRCAPGSAPPLPCCLPLVAQTHTPGSHRAGRRFTTCSFAPPHPSRARRLRRRSSLYRESWPSLFLGPRGSRCALHVDTCARRPTAFASTSTTAHPSTTATPIHCHSLHHRHPPPPPQVRPPLLDAHFRGHQAVDHLPAARLAAATSLVPPRPRCHL